MLLSFNFKLYENILLLSSCVTKALYPKTKTLNFSTKSKTMAIKSRVITLILQ